MLTALVRLKVQPGKADQLIDLFAKLGEEVRKEPGNLRYDLFRSTSDPATFLVYEAYVDQAAMDAHVASPTMKAAFPTITGLLAGTPEAKLLQGD